MIKPSLDQKYDPEVADIANFDTDEDAATDLDPITERNTDLDPLAPAILSHNKGSGQYLTVQRVAQALRDSPVDIAANTANNSPDSALVALADPYLDFLIKDVNPLQKLQILRNCQEQEFQRLWSICIFSQNRIIDEEIFNLFIATLDLNQDFPLVYQNKEYWIRADLNLIRAGLSSDSPTVKVIDRENEKEINLRLYLVVRQLPVFFLAEN